MGITDHALRIHHADQWHASHFEEIDLLSITQRHLMIQIGQADKRQLLLIPILAECILAIGTNGENLPAALRELLVLIAQAR